MDAPSHYEAAQHQHDEDPERVEDARERPAAQDRGARHRERAKPVDDPLRHVVGECDRRRDRGKRERLDEDPGHQVLAVAAAARERDRAAEDVREQHDEHDRLEDREDRQLRDAWHALEGAPRDDEPVGGGGRKTAHDSSSAGSSAAACPVSVRKTSSSVGRRKAMSSIPMPASPSARTTPTSCCAPPSGEMVSRFVRSSSAAEPSGASTPAASGRRARSCTTTSMRSPPNWDLSSAAVPRAQIRPGSTTAISSASSSASSRYCVVRSSVFPSRTWSRITSQRPSRLRGASPVVRLSKASS